MMHLVELEEGYKRGRPWSKKARFYSREVSADGYHRARLIITEEDLAHFFWPREVGHQLWRGQAPHCLWLTHRCCGGYP